MDNKSQWNNPKDESIKSLLKRARTIAIVGLSSNPDRDSHEVASFLKSKGYRIIPVNPKENEILGEMAYPDLKSLPGPVDIVDVFRRPEHAFDIVKEAAAAKAPAVWLQLGVVSPEAFATGIDNGIMMIMDRCMAQEYRRLMN